MGFFKDFKNDMKQAVNELIPGNEEMASEYDDEDMVNTLEETPDDNEYINTMDESSNQPESSLGTKTASEMEHESGDDFEDIDVEDIDIDEAELEEESARYESDMESLQALLSGDRTVNDEKQSETPADAVSSLEATDTEPPSVHTKASAESQELEDGQKPDDINGTEDIEEPEHIDTVEAVETLEGAEKLKHAKQPAEASKAEAEPVEKENTEMTDDKIIEITSIKEPETTEKPEASTDANPETPNPEEISDSTTYITKGTRIEGNVFTDGSVDLLGTVEGDVNCYGKLVVSGSITGKVNAGEIYANAAKVEGEIVSAGSVKIGVGSVIIGNIDAQSAVIAGAVNGEVDVKGPVIVDSTAVIMGNIKSRSVQINNGAVIEGFCSQCYSDIDVKSFFA